MNASKKIGRLVLLKHFLILLGIIIILPLVIELIEHKSVNVVRTLKEAFKLNSMDSLELLLFLVHLIILSIGIWFIGGKAGKSIIDDDKPKYRSGFLAVFTVWIVHLASSFVIQTISFGLPRFGYAQLAIIAAFLCGFLHSLIDGHFVGSEIKRKGSLLERD